MKVKVRIDVRGDLYSTVPLMAALRIFLVLCVQFDYLPIQQLLMTLLSMSQSET